MKLALILTIFKRHDLEKLVIERFKEQSKKFGFEIIIAGSEGEVSQSLANGCNYIEIDNYPVSRKHNATLEVAKELDVDGVVLFGSDDFVNDGFWEFIYKQSPNEKCLVGFKDLYFYSTQTDEFGYYEGWGNNSQSIGAGRFFSRYILDLMDWKLWSDDKNKALDTDSGKRLQKQGVGNKNYKMSDVNAFILDVKHTRSITSNSILAGCELKNKNIMAKKLNKQVAESIENLSVEIQKEQSKEIIVDVNSNGMVVVYGTGKFLDMPCDEKYEVTEEMSKILIKKGFAKQ
jgi:hypothetical protein